MTDVAPSLREHPAKWNRDVLRLVQMWLSAERRALKRPLEVLDPFAGTGRIHDIPERIAVTTGVELEPEWAACREGTIVGDATALPADWSDRFDAVATSPCYGNRMSDNHVARDACYECKGTGVDIGTRCGNAPWICEVEDRVDCACGFLSQRLREHNKTCPTCAPRRCKACDGNGLSRRHTYRHTLGRALSEGSAAVMQWGEPYRQLHTAAIDEMRRVVCRHGLVLINMKDHYRDHKLVRVTDWWAKALKDGGMRLEAVQDVEARGTRHGANNDERAPCERLIVGRVR